MSTSAQIRLLLAVVCATFLLTAFVVKQTFTPKVNLMQTGSILQSNLNEREAIVNKLLNNKARFITLKHLDDDPAAALNVIQDFTSDNRIWVFTFLNNHLKFWSGVKVLPENPLKYHEGPGFIQQANGDFMVIKKTEGNFAALFFIPVKNIFYYQNRYLKNGFDKNILQDNNIEIADFTDKPVFNIHAVNNKYLFSIKLKPGGVNHRFYYFYLTLWFLGFITLCVLIHKICNYIAAKGYTYLSIGVLAMFICLTAFVFLKFNWPDLSDFEMFRQTGKLYYGGALFPSLGHFCLNMLLGCWFVSFVYYHRNRIIKGPVAKLQAYFITIIGTVVLIGLAILLLQLYEGLVVGSVINFDVSNLFNLTFYSRTGILMLCFSFLLFYLANDIFLNVIRRLNIPDRHKVIIFCVIILIASFSTIIQHQLSGFYILTGLFIAIRAYTIWYNQGRLNATSFLLLLSICALISAIKLNYFQQLKEVPVRKALVHKLETADDPVANIALHHIEKKILSDPEALAYFNQKDHNDAYLRIYLKKKYFDGYLSKYDLKLHTYNAAGQTLTADTTYLLNAFRDLVAFTAFKVSSYFYHDDYFGRQSYFAILPVADNKKDLGTIVIELHSTPLEANITFPELLVNGEIMKDDNFKDYSYAYYVDNQLQNQGGQYPYKVRIASSDFSGQLKTYTTKLTGDINKAWYRPFAHYNHLVYKPDQRSTIVVTLYENTLGQIVTSVTFFFLNFLIFSGLVILLAAIWKRVRIYSVQNKQIKWGLRVNLDKVAYRTRIQFSVMATVVFTLLLIGIITIQSINIQYQEQQDKMIRDKLLSLANAFEDGLKKNYYSTTQEGQVRFNDFADSYRTDLTLFNRNGVKILTTQPKLYETGLTASRMNGRAFIIMGQQHQSLLLNKEKLGDLNFQAAYIPIKDTRGVTTAYLQLPYFDNETDYTNRTGALLNDMTNIYALVFVAVGLFAIIIARQITGPLQFIQLSISKTIYGQKNEPILWDRDDEIGALVKEYNKMISALEVSAQRLAQSERESAWREMAKQVAHEIKNPLTPLKLGLQLLDKAWKDKDPKFDQKFERFSKSFVEQIDSLSSIASEFSAFAKMPDTKMERVNLFDIINQAVIIFKQMDNVTITYTPGDAFYVNADRDQLMRCFNNLLKNAIEAMPLGKHALISISYKTEANNVLIMLTDNGNGIPDNLREKIFVPNFTTKSSGTGLGLAFVKNSIENTGGKVWFETETGKGTTFFISCPAAG